MASETSEKCPQCGGQAQAFAVMCGPREAGGEDMKCAFRPAISAEVSGIVESTVAGRYRRGDAIRKLRVKKWRLTQRQQAYILRIKPELLNDIERGRAEWRRGSIEISSQNTAMRERPALP